MNPFATTKTTLEALLHVVMVGVLIVFTAALFAFDGALQGLRPFAIPWMLFSLVYAVGVWRYVRGYIWGSGLLGMRLMAAVAVALFCSTGFGFVQDITGTQCVDRLGQFDCVASHVVNSFTTFSVPPGILVMIVATVLIANHVLRRQRNWQKELAGEVIEQPPAAQPQPQVAVPAPTAEVAPAPPVQRPKDPAVRKLIIAALAAPVVAQALAFPFNPEGWAATFPFVGWAMLALLFINPLFYTFGIVAFVIIGVGFARPAWRKSTAVVVFILSLAWSVLVFQSVKHASDQEFTG